MKIKVKRKQIEDRLIEQMNRVADLKTNDEEVKFGYFAFISGDVGLMMKELNNLKKIL